MPKQQVGYQPRNTPAERRAFFDLRRELLDEIAAGGGGGGGSINEVQISAGTPTDPDVELWYDTDAASTTGIGPYAYVHNQASPATVWTINHPLSFIPNIAIVDSAGDQVEGEVRYVDADTVQLTFTAAFSGIAYLS
jgi:hypothetical protein